MADMPGVSKELIELVKLAYPDLLEPSLKELGIGLGTLFESMGLPLLRLKYFNIKTKLRFKSRVEKLLSSVKEIPPEERVEIPSSIAVPVLDQLSLESDEDISDLYINLLTKASCKKTANEAHPSFISCLRNMSNDEARLIGYFSDKGDVPFVRIRLQFNAREGLDKTGILTGIERRISLQFPDNIPFYFENLTGLGILSRETGSLSDTDRWYSPLFELYEPLRARIHEVGHTDGKTYEVVFVASYYRLTSYGRLFIAACLRKYDGTVDQ